MLVVELMLSPEVNLFFLMFKKKKKPFAQRRIWIVTKIAQVYKQGSRNRSIQFPIPVQSKQNKSMPFICKYNNQPASYTLDKN